MAQRGRGSVLMLQPALETGEAVSGWWSDYTQWQPNLEAMFDAAARAAGADVFLGWQAVGLERGTAAFDPDRCSGQRWTDRGRPA